MEQTKIIGQACYTDFFESHPQPSFILECGRIADCNDAARVLFKLSNKQQVVGQILADFFETSGFCNKQWLQRHLDLSAIQSETGLIAPAAVPIPVTENYTGTYYCQFKPASGSPGLCYLFIETGLMAGDAHEMQLGSQQIKLSCNELVAFVSTLFLHFEVGIKVSELDSGNIVAANQALLDMLGYNESELLGLPVEMLMVDSERAAHRQALKTLAEQGYHDACVKHYRDAEGRVHVVSLLGSILSELNQKQYAWTFVANLSAVEQQNQLLLKREQRLNFAQKQSKMGNWEMDLVHNTLFWSDQVYRIFELDKAQVIPSYELFLEAIHPDDRDAVNAAYQQSLVDKTAYSIRHRLCMADGRIKYVYENCQTDFDEAGKPLISLGTIQDITVAHQAQQELANLARIVQASKDFIGMANPDGRIVFINEAGRKMINFDANLAVKPWYMKELYIEADQQRIRQEVIPTLLDQGQWTGELKMQVFGSDDVILGFCDSFRIDDQLTGQPISLACVTQNITEKRAAEQRLAAYHNQLELLVEERTEELVAARELAVSANRAKSEFLSRVSHELRTPLNAVLGFAQILSYELEPAKPVQRDHLQEILLAGNHLLDMINDILDLSEIEIGEIERDYQSKSLVELLGVCVETFIAEHPGFTVPLEFGNLPEISVITDQQRFSCIFTNVLSNSIKFSSGDARIVISAELSDHNTFQVRLMNTGLMLNEQQIKQAFLPFERLSESFDLVQGSGIGLALSKELVQWLGGTIKLESIDEQGTACVLSFPLRPEGLPKPGTSDNSERPAKESTSGNGKFTLLYIEDNKTNMRLMRRFLSSYPQFILMEARSATEGFQILENTLPDLILLDLSLPDRSGIWVYKALRNEPRTAALPVIAVTANAMSEDAQQYQALGFDDCYFKPLDYQKLLSGIQRLLDRKAT